MGERLLILGGTTEAGDLARRAADRFAAALDLVTSWAGRTGGLPDLPGEARIGGFGGPDALAAYLRERGIGLVVDATHPFAARISANARQACEMAGVARLQLLRPGWERRPDVRWIEAATLEAAATMVPGLGRRVFLTTGAGSLPAFRGVSGVWFLVRLLEPPSGPVALPHGTVVTGRPPFTVEREQALMTGHRIDLLVTKDSGGEAGWAKIEAAARLVLPVLVIRRPSAEPGEVATTVEEALSWLAGTISRPS